MDPRLQAVLSRQHGLICYQNALAFATPAQIRRLVSSGRWLRVRRGVFVEASAWAAADEFRGRPLLRVRAAEMVLGVEHVFSHDSGAILHGLPLPDSRRSLIHVTRPDAAPHRVKAGIKHHRATYEPDQAVIVAGLPALNPIRTALDLCREHGLVPGVAAVDALLHKGVPRSALVSASADMASWRSVGEVRTAIELGDGGADNYAESAVRVLVTELGWGRPETQFGLTDGHRTVWGDLRVGRHIIEVDGRQKYDRVEDGGFAADPRTALWQEKQRQDFITGFHLGVSRVVFADLHTPEITKRRLDREIRATHTRFGADLSDLAPFIVRRRRSG